MNEMIRLTRECEAIIIPDGNKTTLKAGTGVYLTQALGGSFTIMTEQGYLMRIAGKDADAIGQKAVAMPSSVEGADLEKLIWGQLKTIYDPEIPVNVVDLGLIYECKITSDKKVEIKLALTAPGCGMGDVLKADAEQKIASIPGIKEVNVEVVMEPPWTQDMMSEAAKLQLGMS